MTAFYHFDEPKLPPELEEKIFIQAIDDNFSDVPNIILVAKRVHHWLIPHIFNVVLLHEDKSFPVKFNLPTFQRYAKHIRHLSLDDPIVVQHLPLFTDVTNLVLWQELKPPELEILLTFNHLTHLSVTVNDIQPSPVYFSLFRKVTHLDLISSCTNWPLASTLIIFPLLTHLCILRGINTDVLKLFLDRNRCRNLKVVIVWGSAGTLNKTFVSPKKARRQLPAEDERLLNVLCHDMEEDWKTGARGGDDMWRVADRYLASASPSDLTEV
ncbi:hypothetical protein BDN72DRAFT_962685 [Pluteus cervinus]|uniref:Uncharacterized protein n=1 Tax=Pluteus cervinus TaxID=181527 RepID=A0ACD3AI13_9AGAR|nr:hypothetical protein BDN72DRAFT_962685 [Pluteus cervinus]